MNLEGTIKQKYGKAAVRALVGDGACCGGSNAITGIAQAGRASHEIYGKGDTAGIPAAATATLCLALLVKGDPEAVEAVQSHRCITIDGCAKACAQKNVEIAGGRVEKAIQMAEAFRNFRGAKPGTATALTEDGWTIARAIAKSVHCEAAILQEWEGAAL